MHHIKNKNRAGPPATPSQAWLAWRAGQTIIEAIAALATILVILAAISVAIISGVNNSTYIRSQSLAGKSAQEGMETIRYTRNNYPTTFNAYSGSYCMDAEYNPDDPEHNILKRGGCTVNIPEASLIREVQFTENSGECSGGKQVAVIVSWSSGKCDSTTMQTRYCHKSQIVSCFADQSESGIRL